MSDFVRWKGYLIKSDPTQRGELGWGVQASIINTAMPATVTSPIIWEQTYATYQEAYQAGIVAAIKEIDAGNLP